jgi:Uma2 family endonuclease
MIAAKDNVPRLTPEEYFAWEETQLDKHEYIDGQTYAMSGGSVNHSQIAVRLTTLLSNHLDNRTCETGNSDLRVNITKTSNYTSPQTTSFKPTYFAPTRKLRFSKESNPDRSAFSP